MAAPATRTRLEPGVFRLPVDRIREGYYTDVYFNLAKDILEREGRHPTVTMQVFQKSDSVLGGVDEALAVRRRARRSGAVTGRTRGSSGWSEPRRGRPTALAPE